MRSLSSEMTSSSVTVERENCCRNKRKFRQDPPSPSHVSGDENYSSGNNALPSDGENWVPEARSVEAGISRTCIVNTSSRKGSDVGTNLSAMISKTETTTSRSYHQEQLKLMRFRSGQAARVVQAVGAAGLERKPDESADGHRKASEEDEFYELEEADWDDCTEGELEDLLVKNLGTLYNEVINKIVASGYDAEEALRAVLKRGRCYWGKDAVSNIVENSLAYLSGKRTFYGQDGSEHSFSDLKELHKYSLAEMVGLLREVRPLLSKGEAMWCLLMCDMNVPLACVMDDSAFPPSNNNYNKEPCPGPNTNHSGQAKVVVGPSSSPPLPPPCYNNLPTCSIANSSDSHRSMNPPGAASAVSSLVASVAGSPISSSSAIISAPSPPPPPSLSSPDVSLLPLFDSIPAAVSKGLLDEISSNFEESSNEEGSRKVTNLLAAVGDCTSSEVDNDGNEYEEEVKVDDDDLTNSFMMPEIASLQLDERVEQGQGSITDSGKNLNLRSSMICEAAARVTAEPSPPVMDYFPTKEIEKVEDLDISALKERTSEPPLHVGEKGESCESQSTTDGIVSNTKKPWQSACPPTNSEANGFSEGNSTCIRPENSSSIVEPMSSPVQFGTIEEPAAVISITDRFSSNAPQADADTTSSVNGTVITHEALQAFLQAAQKTDAECLVKETSLSEAPECLSSKDTSVSGKEEVEDQKDEMIMKLIHRSKELETQLQERTEWAKQKVMQAARRLSNDLQELKALRLEREEALRLKKDKQALEDSTMKKLTDAENALRKAKSQLDEANKTVKKFEAENANVHAEMQAAKLSAAEAQSSCQEMAKRERKSSKRVQAWEKQRAKLQEELSEEKRKFTGLQQQLILAKERQLQAEVRWRQEEKAKDDALLRADYERRAREQAETAAKKREESLRRKTESNYQRHREDIQRLETEIVQYRTSAEAAQLATSRWGPGVAVTPHMMDLSSLQALKESNNRLAREIAELQDMARRDVHRERECVMCMCEEMSVVFLPCAHQVVCVKCNELHEKQGMRDCPSCRTPIKQRIRVYGVST